MLKNNDVHEITPSEFHKQYPFITNHIDRFAGFELNGSAGCLFETYGEELAFVCNQAPRTIWTLVDIDGDEYLLSGFHFVNRMGYLVSTVPFPENTHIQVQISGVNSLDASDEDEDLDKEVRIKGLQRDNSVNYDDIEEELKQWTVTITVGVYGLDEEDATENAIDAVKHGDIDKENIKATEDIQMSDDEFLTKLKSMDEPWETWDQGDECQPQA